MQPLSVAVDGPAGSGKSTVAKEVALRAGLTYVDSGAIYRTVTWCALAANVKPGEAEALGRLIDRRGIRLAGDGGRFVVTVGGREVGDEIRSVEVTRAVPLYSAVVAVRDRVSTLLRDYSGTRPIIMDGRDIGTVVLPGAALKVFLTATPEIRARRRLLELEAKGAAPPFEEVLADVVERDRRDTERPVAPLRQAPDAVLVETSAMTRDAVIETILRLVAERRPA